jgi:diguanylate cyclase (GGDEF)-like protein
MQTLNLLDSIPSKPNNFNNFSNQEPESYSAGKQLLEQLQTTLDIKGLLNIFAMEVSKIIDFSGLYFQQPGLNFAVRGSKSSKVERKYELKIHDEYVGSLNYALNSPISLSNHKKLTTLHNYLAYPIRNALMYHKAMQLAMEDGLTGLGNRRHFDEQMHRAINHANRQQSRVGIVLGDLDKFKNINDTYGHAVGDDILIHFSQALKISVRDSDSVFRFGGDEFAIIVEDASNNSLDLIKTRINHALQKDHVLDKYKVACSLGTAFMNRADNVHSLFERADQNLYQQKIKTTASLHAI